MKNTSYFHDVANGKCNRNLIPWVIHNNVRVEEPISIGDAFSSFYQNLYGTAQDFCIKLNWSNLLGTKTQHDLSSLDTPFSYEEIKRAVFDMSVDKTPGPNGLPILFYHRYWDIIKFDFLNFVMTSTGGEQILNGLTRPISL